MSKLPLTIATWNYDRVRALIDGDVRVEGCEVNHISLAPEEVFFRAFGNAEFDVTEMSLSSYLIALSRGNCAYRAIPVFPSRSFRHSAIYIRTDRGIERPEDLRGRPIGVPEYQVTAAVWVRGILADEYGVGADQVEWLSGGIEEPGRHEKLALDLPSNIHLRSIGPEKTLSEMLRTGEIDAMVTPRAPSCFMQGAPHVGRLWPDFRAAEKAYFAKTGIFPIMHVLGVRNDLVERAPWLPASLCKAFEQAKRACYADLEATAALKMTLPWVTSELEETRRIMGQDFWPYGIEANRPTLEAALRYSYQQGLSKRQFAIEDIFIKSTLATVKV